MNLPDIPCFYDPKLMENSILELPDAEQHHAQHVLRLTIGSKILVSNGTGRLSKADIIHFKKKTFHYKETENLINLAFSPFQSHIACGVLHQQVRMEWMIEKLVEIGVGSIFIVQNQRSQKKHFRIERLEKAAIAALKQSRKAFLPAIKAVTISELLALKFDQKLIALCTDPPEAPIQSIPPSGKRLITIGPEGDFTSEEHSLFVQHEFIPCSLGSERLRSETAAIYALIKSL